MPRSKGAQLSFVWDYVSIINDKESVKCNTCNQIIEYKQSSTTTKIINHLKKHGIQRVRKKRVRNNDGDISGTDSEFSDKDDNAKQREETSMPVNKRIKLDDALCSFIIHTRQAFSLVRNPWFLNMLQEANASYKVPCKDYLSKTMLPQKYKDECERLAQSLHKQNHITVTGDVWSSNSNQSYLGVTAHFVNSKMQYISKLLEMIYLNDPNHTAEYLRNELLKLLEEWKVVDKVKDKYAVALN